MVNWFSTHILSFHGNVIFNSSLKKQNTSEIQNKQCLINNTCTQGTYPERFASGIADEIGET